MNIRDISGNIVRGDNNNQLGDTSRRKYIDNVRSGLLFIEFRSDWFLYACSMARTIERQRKVASDKV